MSINQKLYGNENDCQCSEREMRTRSICFVDRSESDDVQSGLQCLCNILAEANIEAEWCSHAGDAKPGSILILHDPVPPDYIPDDCRVLGQRTLNRRERLVLAEQCGLPVPGWRSIRTPDEIIDCMDQWNVECVLFKPDWSYGRKGIRVLRREDVPGFTEFDPDADVIMRIVDGDHHTYKYDVFFSGIIGCRHIFTRSVLFDPSFHRSFTQVSKLGSKFPVMKEMKTLGRAAVDYGVGLFGIDIMFDRAERPWVIELNTSSVGRDATWRHWPDVYIPGYADAIKQWVAEDYKAEFSNGIAPLASTLSARSGGVSPRDDLELDNT